MFTARLSQTPFTNRVQVWSEESGLPEPWEVRVSNSKNLPYYFNPDTKESRWEPPEGADAEKLKNFMASNHTSSISRPNLGDTQEDKIRCAHLLIKHRESRRPSSWRESRITRSKEDAMQILLGHEQRIRAGSTSLGELAMVESDCSSARKRGDL
jgi:NIMA-interacting peptidyl-prolyl cis-trans isomerase 1